MKLRKFANNQELRPMKVVSIKADLDGEVGEIKK